MSTAEKILELCDSCGLRESIAIATRAPVSLYVERVDGEYELYSDHVPYRLRVPTARKAASLCDAIGIRPVWVLS